MKFVFFRFRRTEKMDSVMKGMMGAMPPPQNFWARAAPENTLFSEFYGWTWCEYNYTVVSFYTTGTYNDQYMIVDMKKVTLGRELADGTLWVVEQVPGLVVGDDQTEVLRFGLFLYLLNYLCVNSTKLFIIIIAFIKNLMTLNANI